MKTSKRFAHADARTIEEGAEFCAKAEPWPWAGGTDLLGAMRFEVLPDCPGLNERL